MPVWERKRSHRKLQLASSFVSFFFSGGAYNMVRPLSDGAFWATIKEDESSTQWTTKKVEAKKIFPLFHRVRVSQSLTFAAKKLE